MESTQLLLLLRHTSHVEPNAQGKRGVGERGEGGPGGGKGGRGESKQAQVSASKQRTDKQIKIIGTTK